MPKWITDKGHEEYWERAKAQAAKQGHAEDWPYVMGIFLTMTKNKSMPMDADLLKGLVKPGQEHLWERAEKQAAMFGRARDYEYVLQLFKRMTGWKSMSSSTEKFTLRKAFQIPAPLRTGRVPGQVPSRANMELMRLAERKAPAFSMARLLAHDEPRMTVESIVKGLGFDAAEENAWRTHLRKAVDGAINELVLRSEVLAKCREDGLGSVLSRALVQRTLNHWRGLKKGEVQIVTVDEMLQKAESRGGSYHRRTPKPGGGYRYFYDEASYRASKGAHESGKEVAASHVSGKVVKAVEEAGEGGCGPDAFRDLVKKFGAKAVAGSLKDGCGGKVTYKGGKFSMAPADEPSPEKPKMVLKKKGKLEKSGPHKYKSRKRVKGKWVYEYEEPKKQRKSLSLSQAIAAVVKDKDTAQELQAEIDDAAYQSVSAVWDDVFKVGSTVKWGSSVEDADFREADDTYGVRDETMGAKVIYPEEATVTKQVTFPWQESFEGLLSSDAKEVVKNATVYNAVKTNVGEYMAEALSEVPTQYQQKVSRLGDKVGDLAWAKERLSYETWIHDSAGHEVEGESFSLDVLARVDVGDPKVRGLKFGGKEASFTLAFPLSFSVQYHFPGDYGYQGML